MLLSLRQERKRHTSTSKQRDIGVSDGSPGSYLHRKRKPRPYVGDAAPHKRSSLSARTTNDSTNDIVVDVGYTQGTYTQRPIANNTDDITEDCIVVDVGSTQETYPERLIANNATHSFIWTSGLEYSNTTEESYFEGFTIPQVNIGMHTIASICPTFEQSNFAALRKALGYGFAFIAGKADGSPGIRTVHQGVLMMEIIKHSHQRRTIYQRLELLRTQPIDTILKTTRSASSDNGYNAVIILDYNSNPECVKRLRALASLSEIWSRSGRRIRIFPHEEELEWYHCKIKDIIALNELACYAEETGEHAMAYRPLTCHGRRVCALTGKETVIKASYSSETRHVRHLGVQRDPLLLCRLREEDPQAEVNISDPHVYFHQETVHTLQTLGEFRVLITTVPNREALRGRQAHIVFMLCTSFKGSLARTPFLPLSGSESFWGTILPLNIDKLREYAVYIFNALRQRPDWREHFESLEVGVRLDIGVSPENNCHRFFVNEITRFQQGNWFSTVDAPPHQQYPAALARALDAYFPAAQS